MIYYSDAFLDSLLLEDIHYGDLTTRALGIGAQSGEMHFSRKQAGYVSGLTLGQKLLEKLGLQTQLHANDGDHTEAGTLLLTATGRADALHQGWKMVQNVIEWSSGVTQMTRCMVDTLRQYQPDAQLACTRKNIPAPNCWQPQLYWQEKASSTVRAARKLSCCLPITAVSWQSRKTGVRRLPHCAVKRRKRPLLPRRIIRMKLIRR